MNEGLVALVERHHGDRDAALSDLLGERDRLREALEWIAGYGITRPMLVDAPPLTQTAMREIARTALELGSGGE